MIVTKKIVALQKKLVAVREGMANACGKEFTAFAIKQANIVNKIKDVLKEAKRLPEVKAAAAIIDQADEETKEWLGDNSFTLDGSLDLIARQYCPDLTDDKADLIDWAIEIQLRN